MTPNRRTSIALGCIVLGLVLAGLGTGASLAYRAEAAEPNASILESEAVDTGGLAARLLIHVHALGLDVKREVDVDPAELRGVEMPGVTVERQVDTGGQAMAPVSADVQFGLLAGDELDRSSGSAGIASSYQQSVALTPAAEAATLAAAAFAGAGLLAYFWASVKVWVWRLGVLPFIPLYAHVTRSEVFDNAVRERIYAVIAAEPGIAASELSRRAEVSWGTTMYHLDVLEQTRMVSSMRDGRYRRYFQNGGGLDASKEVVAMLRNPTTSAVIGCIREAPGASQKDLAAAMGLSPQALHWHLARLVKLGVVEKRREGRLVRHFPA